MRRPVGVTSLSLFFLIGGLIAGLAVVSLLDPGSMLEPMWRLNPRGHQGLAAVHPWGALLLGAACAGCLAAGIGLWRLQPWGRTAAIVVLSLQMAGDVVNAASGTEWRAAIGVPIVVALLAYLTRPSVRAVFQDTGERRHVRDRVR